MDVGSRPQAGRVRLATSLRKGPNTAYLELLVELGVYVQADEHGLCEACWGVGEMK